MIKKTSLPWAFIATSRLLLLNACQHYLDFLRKPELITVFRETYVNTSLTSPSEDIVVPGSTNSGDAVQEQQNVPAAYPMIQPMKAAFHFTSVEGFGDWRIFISTSADKDLREARRSDQKRFAIYVKKIK